MLSLTQDQLAVPYLIAGVLFIMSLGGLSNQESARRGNVFGIIGMISHVALGQDALFPIVSK